MRVLKNVVYLLIRMRWSVLMSEIERMRAMECCDPDLCDYVDTEYKKSWYQD